MSRVTLFQGLLMSLEGKVRPENRRVYLTREQALNQLRELTGKDFGYEAAAWRRWLREQRLR